MSRHLDVTVDLPAPPNAVFARLDDQTHLAEHMERPSTMMGGGRMVFEFDAARGQAVGSHIKMGGSAFGLSLFVDEVVTDREPPKRKAWKTVGAPRLLIVGAYRMGFDIEPRAGGSRLRVWIAYDLPPTLLGGWLGRALAPLYARWCVDRMAKDAALYFAGQPSSGSAPASAARP
jgi:hypothetical protein